MYVMCLETRMAIWEAEYCSGGYAQHSGANCGGDHGQVYSGSYKVGFSTHATFFLKLLQNQAQTTAF